MIKVFIDTNVIVDLIADRKPFSKDAIELFSLGERKKIKLYVSSQSILTTHYLLKKYIAENQLREIIDELIDFVTIIPSTKELIKKGLQSKYKDFEDGVQLLSAESIDKMSCIITRNIKDFKESNIMVFSPDKFIEYYKSIK
jgi:predicted nucleic acid-binding protein